MRPCAECGTPFPVSPRPGRGRPRLYCSDRCRWRAAKRRSRAFPLAPSPAAAVTREDIAEVLASLLPERDVLPGPPQEELVTAVLELQSVAGRLAALQRKLPSRLGVRAGLLAVRVRDAIRVVFPEAAD